MASVKQMARLLSGVLSLFREDLACYRCGEVGHLKTDRVTGAKCQATRCTLCHSFIGTNAHSARGFCNRSNQVFPNVARSSKKKPACRGRKPAATRGRSSSTSSRPNHNGPTSSKPAPYNTHGDAVKDLPKDVIAAMATLNRFAKAGGDLENRGGCV